MKDQNKNKDDREDLRWIHKAKQGRRDAYEKLVLKYQKRIYFVIRKIVVNHEDTNDIVQDTFVRAFTNLKFFDERYPFYPWLHRIAINTTLNHQKKVARQKETFTYKMEDDGEIFPVNDKNPLAEVIESELKERIAQALEQLPFDQRIVFILRTSEDLSYQEISERLDISIGTVMSRLARARAKLKEMLQSYLC